MAVKFQNVPVSMVEYHRDRALAKQARKRLVSSRPQCVFFLEKVHNGWGIYQGG